MSELEALAAAVAELRTQVAWLCAHSGEPASAVGAKEQSRGYRWRGAPPEACEQLWGELVDWVAWLTARYRIEDTLAGCWYLHPALVEELTALYAGWHSAYAAGGPDPGGWDPLSWHEAFARALCRLRDWDRRGCRTGAHHPDLAPPTGFDPDRARGAGPPAAEVPTTAAPSGRGVSPDGEGQLR